MKKINAFSLTEILIVIFALAIVSAVLVPMNIINTNQAERIAEWKSFYPELQYAFELMQQEEKPLVKAYMVDSSLDPDYFFDAYAKYLNVDEELTYNGNFKTYKHIFLNGKVIKKISKYHADRFIVLKNGQTVAFTKFKRSQENFSEEPLGAIFADIDRKTAYSNRKNIIGQDVFVLVVYPDKLVPMGMNDTIQNMKEDCSPVGSGLKCSAYYLVGGAF